MKRLMKLLTALLVLISTISLWGQSTANEAPEEVPMPMEDLTELKVFWEMLEPEDIWLYLKDAYLQFGMHCGEITVSGWLCEDGKGQLYSKELKISEWVDYGFEDASIPLNYVWNSQGKLLTYSTPTNLEGTEQNLKHFESLKWLFVSGAEANRMKNVPTSVVWITMSANDRVPYDFFKSVPGLKVLDMSTYNLPGTLDISAFPVMESLEFLSVLDASRVEHFEQLPDRFPNLKGLRLDRLVVPGKDLSELQKLSKLEILSIINGTYGEEPWEGYIDFLRGMPKLRYLSVSGFGDIDPVAFSGNSNLERLSFFSSSTDLTRLPDFVNLKYLKPGNIESLKGIERFSSLEALDLSYQTVDLILLKELPNLYWLNLSNGGYQTLDGLEGVDGLRYLNLTENPLTNIDAITQMPNLEVLKLAGFDPNNRSLTRLPDLSGMGKLRILEIKSMPLDEISPLPNPNNMEVFSFSAPGRRLTDLSPLPVKIASFTPSPNLETFYCDLCLDHEMNMEIKNLIDQNLRESYSDERDSKREHFQYRSALYKALKAKWEDGGNDNP